MERLFIWLKTIKFDTRLKGREYLQAAGCVAVIMVLAWYNFIHMSLQESKREIAREMADTRAELVQLTNFSNAHLDMVAYEQEVATADASATRALPTELAPSEFISILQRTALAHHVRIGKIIPAEAVTRDGVLELLLNVTLRTDYFHLLDFLQALGESPRFLLVRSMAVERQDGELECSVVISIFAQPPAATSGTT